MLKGSLFVIISLVLGIILMHYMPHGPIAKFITLFGFVWFAYFMFYDRKRVRVYFQSLFPHRWIIPLVFILITSAIVRLGFKADIEQELFINETLWHTGVIFMWLIVDFFIGLGIDWSDYLRQLEINKTIKKLKKDEKTNL